GLAAVDWVAGGGHPALSPTARYPAPRPLRRRHHRIGVLHDVRLDRSRRTNGAACVGRRGHPEPEGVIGEAPGKVHLVQDPRDVDALQLEGDRIAVTCQTTLSVWDTEDLIGRVKARYPQAEVYNEICRATQERQEAAVEAARA